MLRTGIKICGMTRVEDVRAACSLGVDAIGLVFYAPSPRAVTVAEARRLADAAGPLTQVVGLFVDAEPAFVEDVLAGVPLSLLQFHGDETPGFCEGFGRPWLKALRMREGVDAEAQARAYPAARGILLDSYRPGVPGGTGAVFDWARVPPAIAPRVVLAGGLEPGNVGDAVQRVRPVAVDVSGGVEAAPGVKDAGLMAAFVSAVRAADQQLGAGRDTRWPEVDMTQGVGGL